MPPSHPITLGDPVLPPQPELVQQTPAATNPGPATEQAPKTILLPLERRGPQAATPEDAEVHEDLDFMTELPDVS